MIGISLLCLVVLAAPTLEQSSSPCPNVFTYEQTGTEPGRWYGTVNLSTDSTLHSLWLNVVLDSKADILGNWVGDVTTNDNIDFKIENTKMKIQPGPAVAVRFFVQYNPLNKAPRLQAIRLNGREICNANTPQPAVSRPEEATSRPTKRPESSESRPEVRPDTRPMSRPAERPTETWSDSRPNTSQGRPESKPSTVSRPSEVVRPNQQPGNVYPFSIGDRQPTTDRNKFQLTTVKTPIRDYDDESDTAEADDYFAGGHLLVTSKPSGNQGNRRPDQNSSGNQCGKVTRNNPNPLVVNGKPTLEGQWPWQIALYQTQTIDSKYICGGTLISHEHIITAAHCVTRKGRNKVVNKNTLTVYLGKHNLRTSVEGVEIRLISDIKVHPQYNATSYSHDLTVLKLRSAVEYSDFVRAACLWPEQEVDLSYVIGKKGSVVGWGFDDTGMPSEELALVEMPVVDQETCIRSYSEFFARFTSEYTYCAGYRDGVTDVNTGVRKSTSVCNGDSGGGMVFYERGAWHLRGLVSLSVARHNEYRCDPSHYVVFTDLAKFLPWIQQQLRN